MSQHILFQYTFMVIWFAMVIGIGVSAIGVIMQVSVYVAGVGIRWMNFLMPKDLAFSCGWTTIYPFKRQPQKMVKDTQAICWQKTTNYLSVFDPFVGLPIKGLKSISNEPKQRPNKFC